MFTYICWPLNIKASQTKIQIIALFAILKKSQFNVIYYINRL